jgi:hypothetical protein
MPARQVRRVFNALERMPADSHVKISFLEIYNEVRGPRGWATWPRG